MKEIITRRTQGEKDIYYPQMKKEYKSNAVKAVLALTVIHEESEWIFLSAELITF